MQRLEHARFELRLGDRLELLERAVGEIGRRQAHVAGERVGLVLEQHARTPRQLARGGAHERRDHRRDGVERVVMERAVRPGDLEAVQAGDELRRRPDALRRRPPAGVR